MDKIFYKVSYLTFLKMKRYPNEFDILIQEGYKILEVEGLFTTHLYDLNKLLFKYGGWNYKNIPNALSNGKIKIRL